MVRIISTADLCDCDGLMDHDVDGLTFTDVPERREFITRTIGRMTVEPTYTPPPNVPVEFGEDTEEGELHCADGHD